jgi:hypothetical protein
MECLARQGVGYISGLGNISPENDKATIVVLHGQSPVVLRTLHLTHVLSLQYAATRDASGAGKSATAEDFGFAGIDENCGSVIGDYVP